MSSLNKVIIIGRVGQVPTVNYTKTGKTVANFSVATSMRTPGESTEQGYGKNEKTEWHRIVVWDKLAENCGKYLTVGKLCYIEGRIETRTYDKNGEKRYATEIVANNVGFLSPSERNGAPQAQDKQDEIPNFDMVPF